MKIKFKIWESVGRSINVGSEQECYTNWSD